MEMKIEKLRQSIKSNPNLTEEFKCNLGTLTDTLVTVFPNYDYTNYARILSTLNVNDNSLIDEYSSYNKESNTILINTSKIFEDRIDLQHLFLSELIKVGSNSFLLPVQFEGFNRGITEAITSTMNNDESMKKLNPLEFLCISTFSKIVNGETLIDAYMMGDFSNVVVVLETLGVETEEFNRLLECFNKMSDETITSNNNFAEAEIIMTKMYAAKVNNSLKNGQIAYDDISALFDDFSQFLVFNNSELISMYPHHNFANLSGFENIKDSLDKAILDTEFIEEEKFVK